MKRYWKRIEELFAERVPKGHERYFVPGASDAALARLERHLDVSLPADFKRFYRVHDGQGKRDFGLVFGLELLSVHRIRHEWDSWREIGDELNEELAPAMSSEPKGYVRPLYSNPKWVPFTTDQTGTHLGLDFDPAAKGVVGQVIAFGRNQDRKKVMARSFRDFVHLFVGQLESIDWTIDPDGGWEIRHKRYGRRHYHDWLPGRLRVADE
jgi:cell wall assembly regulator SMI1